MKVGVELDFGGAKGVGGLVGMWEVGKSLGPTDGLRGRLRFGTILEELGSYPCLRHLNLIMGCSG